MKKTLASRLTKRIKIMHMTDTTNEYEEKVKAPQMLCNTWAEILDKGARVVKQLIATHPELTHQITIRYRQGIEENMWIDYKGRRLDIDAIINPMEANIELKLLCKEKVK